MLNRYGQESGPVTFPLDRVIMQFRLYQNDSSIDIQLAHATKIRLYFGVNCMRKELASLALLLLSINISYIATSVLCERGFSTMNYIKKNEFRFLSQENLNACMSLGMTSHSVHTFPFHTFLIILFFPSAES